MSHSVKSLAFLPFEKGEHGYYPTLQVGWTLNFEMYFYVVFAAALAVSHRYRGELAAVVIVGIAALTAQSQNAALGFYSETVVVEFILGIIVYRLSGRPDWPTISFLVLVAAIPFFVVDETPVAYARLLSGPHLRGYEWGVPAAIMVYGALWLAPKVRLHRVWGVLGGASYALYLIHLFVIGVVLNMVFDADAGFTAQVLASCIAIGASLVLAVGFHLLAEKPMTKALRRLGKAGQ